VQNHPLPLTAIRRQREKLFHVLTAYCSKGKKKTQTTNSLFFAAKRAYLPEEKKNPTQNKT